MSELAMIYSFAMYHFGDLIHRDLLVREYMRHEIKRLYPVLTDAEVERVREEVCA